MSIRPELDAVAAVKIADQIRKARAGLNRDLLRGGGEREE